MSIWCQIILLQGPLSLPWNIWRYYQNTKHWNKCFPLEQDSTDIFDLTIQTSVYFLGKMQRICYTSESFEVAWPKENPKKIFFDHWKKGKIWSMIFFLLILFQIWRSDCTLGFLRKYVDSENLDGFGMQTN